EEIRIESEDAQALLGNEEVSEEDLENRNPAAIDDVFAGESSVTASGGAAIGQKIFVNGIEESLLSVTIDGARQNKSAFHHTGNVLIDPELLKRVDISEGIAPADAGPGALAGLIAYETKDVGDLLEDGRSEGGILSAMTDTNGTDVRTALTVFGREETGFEWLISGAYHTGDDYEDGDGIVVPGTEPDLTNFIGKLAHETETGERLELSASRTEDNGTCAAQAGPGGIVFCRPDFAGVVGRPNTFVERLSRRESVTFTYNDEIPEGNWDPTFQISYNSQEINVSGVEGINESVSAFLKNEWSFETGIFTAGVDFLNETAQGRGFGPGPFGSSGRERLNNFGIFAQMREDLNDIISVSYGARFDTQRFEAASGQDFTDSGFSANGAIDVQLTDTLAFTAGGATSWGGFELGEAALINFGGAWNYDGFTTSRANSGRAGLRYENSGFAVSGAYFYTEVNDINAVLPTRGARGAVNNLVSEGFDGSISYTTDMGFFRANYTLADVELDGNQ
ncbi:MAG: TonB-dependent receptor, partial [Pseudomonadota bacterium]